MRTIIAGSRGITKLSIVWKAVDASGWRKEITTVISGTARGVDQLGERFARLYSIPVERHPAQWDVYGRSAGHRRNEEMARCADALIAIWDGRSPGTRSMIGYAQKYGLKVFVYYV